MAESTETDRDVSVEQQRASVSRVVDIVATSNTGPRLSSPSPEGSRINPTAFDQETLISTIQSSHRSITPDTSGSETAASASPLTPPEARLESPFGSPEVYGDSDPTAGPREVPQEKVQGNSDESSVTSLRLPLRQSLGCLSCVTIFGGSALTLVAVGFLVFLWAGGGPVNGGTKAQPAWRAIMLHGWATQSVTLTSLLIRFISGAQAGLCTSMVAALLLERRGIPISKVVQLSVTRSVKAGPLEFLYGITSRRTRKTALKLEVLLLFILALTTVGIQFSSTILISDFGTTHLVRNLNRTIVNVALSLKNADNLGAFLAFGNLDSSTVLFGEVDSQTNNSAPDQLGVSDIGTKRRAFLPFQKEDRIGLQYFSGAAFSLVSRATCIRPSMRARLVIISDDWFSISGTINYNQSLDNAGQSPTRQCYTDSGVMFCLPVTFNCSLPVSTDPLSYPQWPAAICHLPINPDPNTHTLPAWDQHSSLFDFTSGSWAHLVFATNIPISYWNQVEQSGPVTLGEPTSYGEWVSNEVEPGKFLNTTLCFSGINTTVASVTMTGNINQTEPNLAWNATTSSFDIGPLKTLFDTGYMRKTPSQRGIFTITGDIQDPAPLSAFNVNDTSAKNAVDASSATLGGGASAAVWGNTVSGSSVGMCNHCSIFGGGVSDDIAALFQYIINTTGRSAIAIDTYLAMLSRSWYYSLLPKFDTPGYVDVVFVAEVVLPLRWSGLTAVLVLVGTNTVLMWIISVLYIRRTQLSLAGNYWHAVAQLVSKETVPLLERSGEMMDDDVAKKLDLENGDFIVKIERSAQDGLVTVVRV